MYINRKVCFSRSHEKNHFPSNSMLPPYFVDILLSSLPFKPTKMLKVSIFQICHQGGCPLLFFSLFSVYLCSQYTVMTHPAHTQIGNCFSGVLMCLSQVFYILSSNDTCSQGQRFTRQLTNQSEGEAQCTKELP